MVEIQCGPASDQLEGVAILLRYLSLDIRLGLLSDVGNVEQPQDRYHLLGFDLEEFALRMKPLGPEGLMQCSLYPHRIIRDGSCVLKFERHRHAGREQRRDPALGIALGCAADLDHVWHRRICRDVDVSLIGRGVAVVSLLPGHSCVITHSSVGCYRPTGQRPEDLDTLYARLLTEGKRNGPRGGLSAQTVRNVHITIQGALSDAERKGTVVRNVADLADAPTTSRNSRTMSVWTSDELRAFLDAISDHYLYPYLYPLYLLAATTGMRRAEIAGLVWRNVDLDTARLTVSQQLLSVEYKLIESDLKTPTCRRIIDLDPHTVAQLRLHRRHQLEDRMATGRRHKGGYVFAKPDGSPIHPDLISQTFERLLAKIDLPRIRLHDLRHTHATILLQQGVNPKVVSERLGHASVSFTRDVYQHVLPGMQAQAAATFGTAIFGDS